MDQLLSYREPTKTYPQGFFTLEVLWTPALSSLAVSTVPNDSYHWKDIPLKASGKVRNYAQMMLWETWQDQPDNLHPIRFDQHHTLTHGLIRLLAVLRANTPQTFTTVFPPGKWEQILI